MKRAWFKLMKKYPHEGGNPSGPRLPRKVKLPVVFEVNIESERAWDIGWQAGEPLVKPCLKELENFIVKHGGQPEQHDIGAIRFCFHQGMLIER